ncbi:aldehyde dehydrogenase family protein [Nonomuraea basaltis]|nr:aldehyde dehydrogenase family protein [Nonomuraea basaltis]
MTITEVTSQPTDAERFSHILEVQRAAYLRDGAPSLAARRSDLHNLKAALIARRSAIEEAINTDFGHRSRHETAMMEIVGVVQGIDYLQRNLRRFMRPTRRHIALPLRFGTNRVEYQPLGVVGVISPWNYPVNLSLMPVVTAIAAGNRVMLKPSKLTPATNAVLASMLSEVFPPEQVTIVSGDGSAFSSLPFDHLVFTGSTEVGRAVMKAASENLVPVTLELGGKSPTIVAKGHVRDQTVSDIVFGKRPYPRGTDHRGRAPARRSDPPPAHPRTDRRARRHRRHAHRPRGDLRPHPPDLPLPRHRRRHQLRQRTTTTTRALLLRQRRPRPAQSPRPHDLRQRHHHARRAGRPSLRRRRRERDGQIPRDRGLPNAQPPQGHPRARSLERHPPPVCPLRQACRGSSRFLPSITGTLSRRGPSQPGEDGVAGRPDPPHGQNCPSGVLGFRPNTARCFPGVSPGFQGLARVAAGSLLAAPQSATPGPYTGHGVPPRKAGRVPV